MLLRTTLVRFTDMDKRFDMQGLVGERWYLRIDGDGRVSMSGKIEDRHGVRLDVHPKFVERILQLARERVGMERRRR